MKTDGDTLMRTGNLDGPVAKHVTNRLVLMEFIWRFNCLRSEALRGG